MFILAGGRRTGKSGKMIEWFLADPMNRVIVTPNVTQANDLVKRIKSSMGAGFPYYGHIMPYHQSESLLYGSRNFEVGIENLEMVLNQRFSNPVAFVTVTGVKLDAPPRDKPWWKFW